MSEGRAAASGYATEALRLIVSGPEPGSEADVELLVAIASMAIEADAETIDLDLVADLGVTADRCARAPFAATEVLRAFGYTLTSLATGLAIRDLLPASFDVSIAALTVYRTLASREPHRYGPDLATALKNCAVLGDRLGRPRDAANHAHIVNDGRKLTPSRRLKTDPLLLG